MGDTSIPNIAFSITYYDPELIEAKKGAADFNITLESATNTQLKF